jgi:hypothetical protein
MYVLEAAAWVLHPEDLAEAIDPERGLAVAIDLEGGLAEARQALETGVHLGVAPEGSTDQAHAPTAAEVRPAWDLEVVVAPVVAAAAAVAAADGGRHGKQRQEQCDETNVYE